MKILWLCVISCCAVNSTNIADAIFTSSDIPACLLDMLAVVADAETLDIENRAVLGHCMAVDIGLIRQSPFQGTALNPVLSFAMLLH